MLLDRADALVEKLGSGSKEDALEILALLDRSEMLMQVLEKEGHKLPEERLSQETTLLRLRRESGVFLREIGGARVLREERALRQPKELFWWWFLDQQLEQQRRQNTRRILFIAGGIAVVILLLTTLYDVFLAPDASTQARFQLQNDAEQLAAEGNLNAALVGVEQALELAPGDSELLVFKGVLLDMMGRDQESQAVFEQAERNEGDREQFLLIRGQRYLSMGQFAAGLADAQLAVEEFPESQYAALLLAQNYQLQDRRAEALAAYERAIELADANDDPTTSGFARMQMAMLVQLGPGDNNTIEP
jgi:tetratricopeptide (TPR) repeat protein